MKSMHTLHMENQIQVRHIEFKFPETTPKYFAFDNPIATAFFVVLSGVFPTGERFFVDSLRNLRDQTHDEQLKQQIRGFIGQEAMHGREHDRFNQTLKTLGFDVDTPTRLVNFSLGLLRKLSKTQQLGCTVAMEHITAKLAIQWLTYEKLKTLSDQETMNIWQWHALEELEHKNVSFDLYQQTNAHGLIQRLISFSAVHLLILPAGFIAWLIVAYKDDCFKNLPLTLEGIQLVWEFIQPVLRSSPEFLSRDFNPRNDETSLLEQQWRDYLVGEFGILNSIYNNKVS